MSKILITGSNVDTFFEQAKVYPYKHLGNDVYQVLAYTFEKYREDIDPKEIRGIVILYNPSNKIEAPAIQQVSESVKVLYPRAHIYFHNLTENHMLWLNGLLNILDYTKDAF